MEVKKWKKDISPYLVFPCTKCGRWLYVKKTQKTKKCLMCNHIHQVKILHNSAEVVEGMSKAISTVKIKQHEFAKNESGKIPDLRSESDFYVASIPVNDSLLFTNSDKGTFRQELENDYSPLFRKLLEELSSKYTRFPGYMIKMMTEEYKIPEQEVKILINKFRKDGLLLPLKNDYYAFKTL